MNNELPGQCGGEYWWRYDPVRPLRTAGQPDAPHERV
jgi:hypothetical protein